MIPTNHLPRISFGMIVLNGQPFLRYNLRAIYPFAHQIIVVEGAVSAAATIASPDGHSLDDTLSELERFQSEEDPEHKLEVVVRDGFWREKEEQSQAYACRATGDYLWQVDVDEFYQPRDVLLIMEMLRERPELNGVSFPQVAFWGSPVYVVDGWYLRREAAYIDRVFRWGTGFQYRAHRPPLVVDANGRSVRAQPWLDGRDLAQLGVYMYHYSLVFPQKVLEKSTYYAAAPWANRGRAKNWAQEVFLGLKKPFRVHNDYRYPSWLERSELEMPPQVRALFADIDSGAIRVDLRDNADVEELLEERSYRLGRALLRGMEPIGRAGILLRRYLRRLIN